MSGQDNTNATDTTTPGKVPPAPKGTLKKVRVGHLQEMKASGRPITVVTAYDAPTAALADKAGLDVLLVGDSVGNTVHGFETTLPVTMDMMILHTAAVARGAQRPLIVADLPFMTFQVSVEKTLENAGRLVSKGGAEAVKLETNDPHVLSSVERLVSAGIPVMGHVGLTPQSVNATSGYRVQGRGEDAAKALLEQSLRVQEAGAFAIVLELVPATLAQQVTERLSVPIIGIGAGVHCDGQVLVFHDLVGLTESPPRFARKYMDMRAGVLRGLRKFARDVREKSYPDTGHSYE